MSVFNVFICVFLCCVIIVWTAWFKGFHGNTESHPPLKLTPPGIEVCPRKPGHKSCAANPFDPCNPFGKPFFWPKDGHTRCKSAVHNLHLALDHPRENGSKDLDCLTEPTVGEVVSSHELEASSWRNVWQKHRFTPSPLQEKRTSKQTKICLWKSGHLPNLHLCGRNTVKLIPTGAMNRAILCTMNISNFCSLWPLSHQFHQDMTGCGTSPAMPGPKKTREPWNPRLSG